jgi:hypothetical protein
MARFPLYKVQRHMAVPGRKVVQSINKGQRNNKQKFLKCSMQKDDILVVVKTNK